MICMDLCYLFWRMSQVFGFAAGLQLTRWVMANYFVNETYMQQGRVLTQAFVVLGYMSFVLGVISFTLS